MNLLRISHDVPRQMMNRRLDRRWNHRGLDRGTHGRWIHGRNHRGNRWVHGRYHRREVKQFRHQQQHEHHPSRFDAVKRHADRFAISGGSHERAGARLEQPEHRPIPDTDPAVVVPLPDTEAVPEVRVLTQPGRGIVVGRIARDEDVVRIDVAVALTPQRAIAAMEKPVEVVDNGIHPDAGLGIGLPLRAVPLPAGGVDRVVGLSRTAEAWHGRAAQVERTEGFRLTKGAEMRLDADVRNGRGPLAGGKLLAVPCSRNDLPCHDSSIRRRPVICNSVPWSCRGTNRRSNSSGIFCTVSVRSDILFPARSIRPSSIAMPFSANSMRFCNRPKRKAPQKIAVVAADDTLIIVKTCSREMFTYDVPGDKTQPRPVRIPPSTDTRLPPCC